MLLSFCIFFLSFFYSTFLLLISYCCYSLIDDVYQTGNLLFFLCVSLQLLLSDFSRNYVLLLYRCLSNNGLDEMICKVPSSPVHCSFRFTKISHGNSYMRFVPVIVGLCQALRQSSGSESIRRVDIGAIGLMLNML